MATVPASQGFAPGDDQASTRPAYSSPKGEPAGRDSFVQTPLPGLVVAAPVADEEWVEAGEVVAVVESMKCETPLTAPQAGYVSMEVVVGDALAGGDRVALISSRHPDQRRARPMVPWAVIDALTGQGSWNHTELNSGQFTECDLVIDADAGVETLEPVVRTRDEHEAGLVVGVISHRLRGHSEPVERVWIAGDPRHSLGALAEPECRRIMAAIDLAQRLEVAVEWVAVSAGARISWDSGTENMDWCAAVARRIIEFTAIGGVINIIVAGVNVGAQSYWDSLATMLPDTRGALIQIDDHAMMLTGPAALAISGGGLHGSANEVGGYAEVMGPNGEAHYRAPDLPSAYRTVLDLLALSRHPEGAALEVDTIDPTDRSICDDEVVVGDHHMTLGSVLEGALNPKRKAPFPIRAVIQSLCDSDAEHQERWEAMAGATGVVAIDSRVNGYPLAMVGVDGMPRQEGDESGELRWRAGGTLYPGGSRKMARALVAASDSRPAVVLASLAGFDGSAESLAARQLEYGAAIAQAVTQFQGPVLVVALGRFHGGAYVVLSRRLNPNLTLVALPDSFVSVIGGEAAAGVVLGRDVKAMVEDGEAPALLGVDDPDERFRLARTEVASQFDSVHSVARAVEVGSVNQVVEPSQLRAFIAQWAQQAWASEPTT